MQSYARLQEAVQACLDSRQFSIARLHKEEKAMDMHIHDCYEVYLTISGGQQFLIEDSLYDMVPNDMFVINHYESHYVLYNDTEDLERLVLFIHPDFVESLSTEETHLYSCFSFEERAQGFSHRRSLNEAEQRLFLFHVHQLHSIEGYGADVMCRSRMAEFLLFLNYLMTSNAGDLAQDTKTSYAPQVREALTYINSHITEPISLTELAEHLYLSESYLCRIFKASTGTTISKYIVGRRIAIAKILLSTGHSVAESQVQCGFGDYSNFLKAFTKTVGMSPKKYAQFAPQVLNTKQPIATEE